MSLVDGFRQGFGMMSDYYNRKDAKEYRQEQLGLQRRRMNMAEESHNANMETAGLNTQILQNQVNDLPAANKYRDETRGLSLDNQKAGLDAKRMQTQVAGQNLSNAKALGGYEAEDRKRSNALERYKVYASTGRWDEFLQDPSFKGTDLELLQNPEGAEDAILLNKGIESGNVRTIVDASNSLFKSKLNRNVGKITGRNNSTIRDISIIDFVQQPDGSFKVPVRVTTDDGPYNSYISEMRGIDPDDPDKVFTAEDLYGKAAAMGQLGTLLKNSGAYESVSQKMQGDAQRYLSPQGGKGNDVPAEVRSVALLSEMTGYSPEEIVRAKYFSQKDPSGATLQKMAIELAQKDPRLTKIGAKPDQQAINAIVGEYLNMLSKPVSQDELNATNNQGGRTNTPQPVPTPTPAPDAAIQALRQDPSLADEFKAKYNYLPEGF
ncbi:hypothetical protein ACQKDY_06650 [Alteromonas macleodii]|uniref:hypothetical protein n=1 Tax=Alteromonas macleodii TaxID=28108 RepID=UPI003D04B066